MCDKYQGAAEGIEDSEQISRELYAASKDHSESERYEREVGGGSITYSEEKPVGEHCKERRKTLDGVD